MASGRLGEDKRVRMLFKPITFRQRSAGVNSINIPKIFKIGIRAIGELISIDKGLYR